MAFVRITTPPEKGDPDYFSYRNIYYRDGYGLPNCPCFALGRYHKAHGIWLPVKKNASEWINEVRGKGFAISMTPKVGAVGVWKGGKDGGHNAFVEAIKNNADIITSNSGWYRSPAGVLPENDKRYKQMYWYEKVYYAKNNYSWVSSTTHCKYELLGFILPPTEVKEKKSVYVVNCKSLNMRLTPGTTGKVLCVIHRGDEFVADGQSELIDGSKWVRGKCQQRTGWVSSKYLI